MNISDNNIMTSISSIELLDRAYAWYRARHFDAPDNHPFWSLSFKWDSLKYSIRDSLQQGTYQFQPLNVVYTKNNDHMKEKNLQLYGQGPSISRLQTHAKNWISWVQSGFRVETLGLKLKTRLILQNICGVSLLLE